MTATTPPLHLLIVEGNHEGLVSRSADGGPYGAAERYAETLSALAPELKVQISRPHFTADPAPAVKRRRLFALERLLDQTRA